MGKTTITLLSAAAIITALPSCAGLRRAAKEPVEITVSADAQAPESADSPVNVNLNAHIPERYRNVNTGILFEPVLVNADGTDSVTLKKAMAEGKFHDMHDRRAVRFKEQQKDIDTEKTPYVKYDATDLEWTAETPYREWMDDCVLKTRIYAEAYTKQVLLKETCIPFSMILPEPEIQEAPEPALETVQEDDEPMFFRMQFALASADLSEDIDAGLLRRKLSEIVNDIDIENYHLTITVSDSPEGTFGYNEELCRKRRDAVLELIRETGADVEKCDIVMIPENWDGLIEKAASLIPDSVNGLRKATDTIADADKREEHIRRSMNIDWIILSKLAYPELRYCHVTLTYNRKNN